MVNKFIALITALFSIIFLSYRKGRNDVKSKQVKQMLEEVRKGKTRRAEIEKLSDDKLDSHLGEL